MQSGVVERWRSRRRHYCAEAHRYADVDATSHLRHPRDNRERGNNVASQCHRFCGGVRQQQSKQTTTTIQRSKLLPTESPRHVAERATLLHDLIARRTMTRTH